MHFVYWNISCLRLLFILRMSLRSERADARINITIHKRLYKTTCVVLKGIDPASGQVMTDISSSLTEVHVYLIFIIATGLHCRHVDRARGWSSTH
jgi:hypothetical protein